MVIGFINKTTTEGIDTITLIKELIEKNKIDKAKRLCETQLTKNLSDPQILLLLSKIAVKQSDLDTAMELLLTAQKEVPTDQNIQLELAKVLYSARSSYPEAAQASLNILKQINSLEQNEEAKLLLAKIFTDSNYLDEAINQVKNILTTNPDNEKAYIQWAKILSKEGKNSEAFSKLEKVIYINPHSAEAYFLLSQISFFNDPEGKYLKQIKETLQVKKLSRQEKTFLNLAVAKAYSDQNNYSKTIQHYVEAATQKNKDLNYDIKQDQKLLETLKNTFSQDVFNRFTREAAITEGSLGEKLIFLVSFPGLKNQNIIETILKDEDTAYLGENSFLSQMLAGSRYSENFTNFIQQFTKLNDNDLNIFRSHYLENVEKITGNNVSLDTSKMNFLYIGLIKLLFPTARIIYLKTKREEALFEAYTHWYEEPEMNFSYNLNNLIKFHEGFTNLMEYWLASFPQDITVIDSNEDKVNSELLASFNQYLSEISEKSL
jgi:tetratricopeptide (TPR) repeat protein